MPSTFRQYGSFSRLRYYPWRVLLKDPAIAIRRQPEGMRLSLPLRLRKLKRQAQSEERKLGHKLVE
jgi:hypothetical protein